MALEYQILIALLIDFALGDPRWVPHPVRLAGYFALSMERLLRPRFSNLKIAGTVCALIVIGATGLVVKGILALAGSIDPTMGDVISILLIYSGIAAKDMIKHSSAVYTELKQGSMAGARQKVGLICGRDPETLDEPGIIRATVESVAENTVDGVIAPLLFAFLGGPVGIWVYKAISTLDSTFGYKKRPIHRLRVGFREIGRRGKFHSGKNHRHNYVFCGDAGLRKHMETFEDFLQRPKKTSEPEFGAWRSRHGGSFGNTARGPELLWRKAFR